MSVAVTRSEIRVLRNDKWPDLRSVFCGMKDCILNDSCCVARRRAGRGFSGEAAPYKFVGGTLTSAAWYFRCGRCLDPPCLFTMYLTKPWYMTPSGLGLLSVCVNCSLSVVAYLGRRQNTFSNVPIGSWVKILRKIFGDIADGFGEFDE